jgi:hypothetical protein
MSLVCIVPDALWHAQQPLKFGPLSITTRMTVVRLGDGSLWVHSPVTPTAGLVESLRAIGPVRHVVAPNKSHHLYFLDFLRAFPEARGHVAEGLEIKRPALAGFARIPRESPWSPDLQGFFIAGLPILNETAWFHAGTGSLILTDLLFCFSRANRGLGALVSRLLGVHDRLGMSRTMKLAVANRRELAASVAPLLALPVRRVIVAHDEIVDHDPAARLARAFAWLG